MKPFSANIALLIMGLLFIQYNSIAQVHIEPANPVICAGESVVLTVVADDANNLPTVFNWSPPDGLDDPFAQTVTATPFATTSYSVETNAGNASVTVTVLDLPDASWSGISDEPFCANHAPIEITPSEPGGAFTTDPIAAGAITNVAGILYFNPSAYPDGSGVFITYTVSNADGCTNSSTRSTTIFPLPATSFSGLSPAYCSSDGPVTLIGTPDGGTFSTTAPSGLTGDELDPSQVPTGTTFDITYTYTGGCTNSATQSFIVNEQPIVSFTGLNAMYCSNESPVTLTGIPTGGTFSTTAPSGLSGDVFDPSQLPTNDSYPITYTYSNGGCSNSETQYVLVRNAPVVNFTGLSSSYCVDAAPVILTGSPAGGTFSTTAPAGFSGNTLDPTQVPTGTTYSITYSFTDANSCSNSETQSFIVNPLPTVSFTGLSSSYCANELPATLTGTPAGGTFSTNASNGLTGNTLDPSQVPTGTSWNITYTYMDANGCSNSETQSFIVNPLPGAGFALPASFCANDAAITLQGDPPGGIFTSDAPSGLIGNTLTPAEVPPNTVYFITYTFTDANSCASSQTHTFTVNSLPAVSFTGLTSSYCVDASSVTLSGNPAGGTFTTDAPSGLEGSVLSPNLVPTGITYSITYTYTDVNGCSNSASQSFVVHDLPTVSFSGLNASYCANSALVTLTGLPAGGIFSTTAPSGLSGSTLTPAQVPTATTYTLTYTYSDVNGCSNSQTQSFIVNPLPTVNFTGLSSSYCVDAAPVTLTGSPAGGTFSTNAPAGFSGSTLDPAQVPTGTNYSITYSFTDGNGCANNKTQSFIVNPLPTVSFSGLSSTYCANEVPVTLTGSPIGGAFSTNAPSGLTGSTLDPGQVSTGTTWNITYTYTDANGCTNSSTQSFIVNALPGAGFALPASFCANDAAITLQGDPPGGAFTTDAPSGLVGNTLTPADIPFNTVYSITYTYTDANGCASNQTRTFTVNSLPTVSFSGLTNSYCMDAAPVILTGSPAGGTFTTDAPGGLEGSVLNPNLVPTGTTFNITYTYTDANGCTNNSSQSFVVHDLPAVSFSGLNTTYCISNPAVTLAGLPSGGIFSTTAPGGLSGSTLTPAQVPTGTTYTISYTYTDGNSCSNSQPQSFIVNSLPAVSFSGLSSSYCVNAAPVTLTGSPAGGTFSTTAPAGFSANILDPSQVPTETNYSITYTFTDANGCANTQTQSFIVNPLPAVSFSGLSSSYCANEAPATLTGSPSGGSFSTNAPSGLTGSTLDPSQVPTGTSWNITYVYIDANGCTNSSTQSFIVNVLPGAGFSLPSSFCANDPAIILQGDPPSGVFTTNAPSGLVGNTLTPADMPPNALYSITYTYTDANGCASSQTHTFTVNSLPVVSFTGLASSYCIDASSVTLTGSPTGGTFSTTAPSGLEGGVLSPNLVPTGITYSITYTYTDVNGCSNSVSQSFVVNDLPTVSFSGLNASYCANSAVVTLTGLPAGGIFSTTAPSGLSGSTLTPAQVPTGTTYTLTYTYSDVNGCSNSQTQNFIVNPLPVVSFAGLASTYCVNAAPVTLTGSPAGGTFSTNAPAGFNIDVLNPNQVPTGTNYTITYSFTDGNICANSQTQIFIVNPLPTVSFSGLSGSYCANEAAVTLTGSPAGGIFSTNSPTGLTGNILDPSQVPMGTTWNITYTYTDANGCSNSTTQPFVVNALPGAGFSLPSSFCANDAAIILQGDPPGGAFTSDAPSGLVGNTLTPADVPPNTPYSITYIYTDVNGCSSSQNHTFTVNSLPGVSFTGLTNSYCVDAAPVILIGSPVGGTFTTDAPSGLEGSVLSPNLVPTGTIYSITYTYTDANGCSNTASQSFIVNDLPTVSFSGLNPTYCANSAAVILTGLPAGGIFSTTAPSGLSGSTLTPAQVPTGTTYTLTYTYSDVNGCSNSQTQNFIVNPLPVVSFTGLSSNYCVNASPVTLTGSPAGGTFSTTAPAGFSSNLLEPNQVPTGTNYSITYTFTDGNGCANTQMQSFIVNSLPAVSFSGLSSSYCANEAPVMLTGSPVGGSFSTNAPSGLTGNTLDPSQVSTGTAWNITYTYTDANGCSNASTQSFIVNALPGAGFSLPSSFCANDAAITLQGDPLGGVFTTNAPSGLISNTLTPADIPFNTVYSITYTYTDANSCTSSQTRTFTVNSLPTVSFSGLSSSYCADATPVTLSGNPTGGTFATDAPNGLEGSLLSPNLVPTGSSYSITYSYTDGNGCTNNSSQSFVVHDLPAVSFSGLNATYCTSNPAVTLVGLPSGGVFSTTAPSGLSGSTLTPAQVPTSTTYTISYTYIDGNSCSNSQTQSFIVNPLPAVSFSGLASTYCIDASPVTLTGSPAGGTFSTTAPAGFSGNTLNPTQVPTGTTYAITYTFTDANSCSNSETQSFIVNPLPTVSFTGLSSSYCANEAPVTLTGSPAGGTFSTNAPNGLIGNTLDPSQVPPGVAWNIIYTYIDANGCSNSAIQSFIVNALPGAGFSLPSSFCANDAAITLQGDPPGGVFTTNASSGLVGNTLTPADVPPNTVYSITYTYTYANGCASNQTRTFTVNSLPTVSFSGLTNIYCMDAAPVILTGSPVGGTFTTDAPGGLEGSVLSPNLVPTGTTFNITYTYTDGNGCTNNSSQSSVVHDLPAVSFSGLSSAYCTNAPVATLTGSPAGGTFSTTVPFGLNGDQLDPSQIPTGITYAVTYQYTDGNGCSDAQTQAFLVNALPAVDFTGLSPLYCASDPAVTLSGTPIGGIFSTDAPTGLNGNVFTPANIPAGITYHLTYSFTNNTGCANQETQSFLVHPPTQVDFTGLLPTYCISDAAVTLTGNPAGGTFTITPNNGLNGNIFDPAQAFPNTDIVIAYTFTDTNGCVFSANDTVLVFTPPTVVFEGLQTSYCANDPIIFLTGTPAGGTFTTTAPSGVVGNQLDPSSIPVGISYSITYSFSAGAGGGCSGSETRQFIVHAPPIANLSGLSSTYCANSPMDTLTGSPLGGIFSTNAPSGLAGNILDPSQVPTSNTYNLSYTYTDVNGCSATDQQPFVVNVLPVVTFSGLSSAYCTDAPPVMLVGNPVGGNFSTNAPSGLNGNVLTPSQIPVGTNFDIFYTYTDVNGCTASTPAQSFSINPLPVVSFTGLFPAVCVDAPAVTLSGSPTGGTFTTTAASGLIGNMFTPAQTPTNTAFSIAYTYTDAQGCTNAQSQSSIVHSLPTVSFTGLNSAYCANDAPVLLTGLPAGGVFSTNAPTGLNGNIFNPDQAPPGTNYTLTYTYTDGNACTNTQTQPFTIHALPVVIFSGLAPTYCANAPEVVITGNPVGGTFTSTATSGFNGNLLDPAQSPTGTTQELTYTYTDANGCTNTQMQDYLIYALPALSFTTLAPTYCSNAVPVLLNGTPVGGDFSADLLGALSNLNPGTAFQPTGLNSGDQVTITYNFQTIEGCTSSVQQTTTILSAPVFALPDSVLFCGEGILQPDTIQPDFNYTWSNGAVTSNLLVNTSGIYTLRVAAPNSCTASDSTVVAINPGENFVSNLLISEAACSGDTLHFFDITEVAGTINGYRWDFGDGKTSTERDPTHVYDQAGDFLVTLEGTLNGCTQVSVAKPISIAVCRQQFGGDGFFESLRLYPNPTDDVFSLQIILPQAQDMLVKVVDQSGRIIENRPLRDHALYQESFSGLERGVYFVHLQCLNHTQVLKVVVLD